MDKKAKEETTKLFARAFGETVLPVIENIDKRLGKMENGLTGVEERMTTKEDIDRLERKLEATIDRADRHGKMLENHEKRIKKAERKMSVASA